ncbi:MAG: hypothetical protein RIM99_05865 [Cyclobacteriaceae bacterium]
MKNIYKNLIALAVLVAFSACDRTVDIFEGQTGTPDLTIVVLDGDSLGVAAATVDLFDTEEGYITETGSIATATTDANGEVTFTTSVLTNPGVYYFNVASGVQRNWSSVSSTNYLLLTDGKTRVETFVADVLPEFIALTASTWAHTSYTNGDAAPACNDDDTFVFLKTGTVRRFDAGAACSPSREAEVTGTDWSSWALNADGTSIDIRDWDPWYYNNGNTTGNVATASLTLAGSTAVMDYGGGYVWTITAQ